MPQLSLHTPVGDLTLSEEDGSLVAVDWGWGRDQSETPFLQCARDQLQAYFDGDLKVFDLRLAPHGTAYRRRIWQALVDIPVGETRSYGGLAMAAGGSARSVGGAMATNPIPIIIPCHRVVGSGSGSGAGAGRMGGYSGGEGLPTKLFLLALERRMAPLGVAQTQVELL